MAGYRGDDLFLAIRTNRLLSAHLAVVSGGEHGTRSVVTIAGGKLLFNTFTAGGQLERSLPIDGAADASLTRFELRLPRSLLSERGVEDEHGLRVGLGMGGRHVPAQGRPVTRTHHSSNGRANMSLSASEKPSRTAPPSRLWPTRRVLVGLRGA